MTAAAETPRRCRWTYLLQPVDAACRPRENRLLQQIPPDIVCELRGRSESPRPVPLERLHGDGIEISSQLTGELPGFRTTLIGRRRGRRVDPGARPGRIFFPQFPQDFIERLIPSFGDRQRPRQQLVEHRPERVHIGPGIHVMGTRVRLLGAHVTRRANEGAGAGQHPRVVGIRSHGLRQTEIDDVRCGPAVVLDDQKIRWFQIAVDDGLLMRVLDAFTRGEEQVQPLANLQLLAVAVVGDGLALHVVHHEERLAIGRGAGVEHLGNGRMIHHRQRLPFRTEALQNRIVVDSDADQLERDLASHRRGLLREPDLAHSAFAQLPHQPVGTDHPAGGGRAGAGRIEPRRGGEPVGRVVGGEERLDFEPQEFVFATGVAQKGIPIAGIAFERCCEDVLSAAPLCLVHDDLFLFHATTTPAPSPSRV